MDDIAADYEVVHFGTAFVSQTGRVYGALYSPARSLPQEGALKKFAWIVLMLMVGTAPIAAEQAEQVVDLELVIAVDVSGSMSEEEHEMQRNGFLSAFADKQLLSAIMSGIRGRIAVTYLEWAGPDLQKILVPWHIVSNRESAMRFRALLAPIPRSPIRGTSISSALDFSAGLFEDNGITSFRRVIDISGDGHNRAGPDILSVRAKVLQKDITINGLPIMLSPAMQRDADGYGLDQYFTDCVIGGPSAFVYPVRKITEFAEAIRRKLILEIAGTGSHIQNTRGVFLAVDRKVDCEFGRYELDDW